MRFHFMGKYSGNPDDLPYIEHEPARLRLKRHRIPNSQQYHHHDLSHGMLFVVGPERMSKARAAFKSMLPGIVFGFIPFIIFMINPKLQFLGTPGILGIAAEAGDFCNVYNTFWYMPQK